MKFSQFIAAITFSLLSVNAFATEINGGTIMDTYKGAGYHKDVYGSTSKYDTDKMEVSRVGTTLTVDIFTSFYNDIGSIGIGDLFMSADLGNNITETNPWQPDGNTSTDRFTDNAADTNTDTDWNYAYSLGDLTYGQSSGTGQLKSGFGYDDLLVSTDIHSSARDNQAVKLNPNSSLTNHNDSTAWSVDNNSSYSKTYTYWSRNQNKYKSYVVDYGKVSFSFDVSGTALATANQIAFRWAMTCANDIIEGFATFNSQAPRPDVSVPEPSTMVLMLLAMAGLIYRRKTNI
jgi:hypothetical protein